LASVFARQYFVFENFEKKMIGTAIANGRIRKPEVAAVRGAEPNQLGGRFGSQPHF
jgi:hypothetical protein